MDLWNNECEVDFFNSMLSDGVSSEKLFYTLPSGSYAYIPKNETSNNTALQSRNALIGNYTETYCKKLLAPIARKNNLYAINTVRCDEISLPRQSEADLAFCTTNSMQQDAMNIKIIFEIKMSIVSNYKYDGNTINYIGDYKTHRGNPSLLRSDSMLKAIGKAINIRVSSVAANNIPIIILGNSPISANYAHKVDYLKKSGVVQGFWSLNPNPTDSTYIKETTDKGFLTVSSIIMLESLVNELLKTPVHYFSSMKSLNELGRLIEIASKEKTYEEKAHLFLSLLNT